jgi:single-strand DNA-binding protein
LEDNLNLIQILGNLGSDPVERFTPSGVRVVSFNIAVNTKKGGTDITQWYRVTIFGNRFDNMLKYLKKGSFVIVIGELEKPEIYRDKSGEQRINLNIIADIIRFVPTGKRDESKSPSVNDPSLGTVYKNTQGEKESIDQNELRDQELPF